MYCTSTTVVLSTDTYRKAYCTYSTSTVLSTVLVRTGIYSVTPVPVPTVYILYSYVQYKYRVDVYEYSEGKMGKKKGKKKSKEELERERIEREEEERKALEAELKRQEEERLRREEEERLRQAQLTGVSRLVSSRRQHSNMCVYNIQYDAYCSSVVITLHCFA